MTYNPLLSRVAAQSAAATQIKIAIDGSLERELPQRIFYDMLYSYYLSNGVYDQLRLLGTYTDDMRLKGLRNPAYRAVEFYAATIWPGPVKRALPLEGNAQIRDHIYKLWAWSNWSVQRQVLVRKTAALGDGYIKIAQPADGSERVYLQLIEPGHVTGHLEDERGYITYARLDVPHIIDREGQGQTTVYHTEIWDQETVRVWADTKGPGTGVKALGVPNKELKLSEWGISFPPIVHVKHTAVGGDYGAGCYTMALDKVQEADLLATRLHRMLFRHNNVTWALQANGTDPTGRPLPPPRVAGQNSSGSGTDAEIVDIAGEKFLRLPGMATLESMVPDLRYSDQLDALNAHLAELREDLPELEYFRLKELPEVSGKALRIMLKPAIARGMEARGNYEDGLVRAHQIALTVGKAVGAWDAADLGDPGDYDMGDYEHTIAQRNLIPLTREEIAELAQAETAAGIPLITSLRRSGWTEEELEELAQDITDQQLQNQSTLAAALMSARGQSGGGEFNDLDQQ